MDEIVVKNKDEALEILVEEAQNGSTEAFSKIYDQFIDTIYRYVYYRVKSDDAEDLVETVFLKVWENLKKYKRSSSGFSSWIFRIAHNLVVDYYRLKKDKDVSELDVQLADDKRDHNPIKQTEDVFNSEILKKALSKLKRHYQEIIVYKFVNEFSNEELAKLLKKSEGSLRILQFRALKALKYELDEMGVKYEF